MCGARVCVRGVCVAGVWDRAPLRASNAVVQFLRMRAWTTTASGRMTNECGMARAEAEEQKTGRWHAQRHCGSAKGSEIGRAGGLAVSLSLTLSPPRVFDNGAGVCVCLSACMRACAGAVGPRSAVATKTRRRERESPPSAKRVDVSFCAGVNVVARTEDVHALPSVGRSLTQSPPRVFDVGAGVCVCLCACMRACAGAAEPRLAVATKTW